MRGLDDHLDNYGDPGPIETPLPGGNRDQGEKYRASIQELAEQRRYHISVAADWTDLLREHVIAAINDGMSESEAARLAGVQRQTIRTWQGK